MSVLFQVFVDDNFHYMDEDARYKHGEYATYDEALAVCKAIVDEFLRANYEDGMNAEELFAEYTMFGEDPFITGEPSPFPFSGREYARKKCREICGDAPSS